LAADLDLAKNLLYSFTELLAYSVTVLPSSATVNALPLALRVLIHLRTITNVWWNSYL